MLQIKTLVGSSSIAENNTLSDTLDSDSQAVVTEVPSDLCILHGYGCHRKAEKEFSGYRYCAEHYQAVSSKGPRANADRFAKLREELRREWEKHPGPPEHSKNELS